MKESDGERSASPVSSTIRNTGKVYLTEASLGHFLRDRIDPEVIANRPVPGSGRRLQPDYRCDRLRLIVEFDGDAHYRSTKTIIGDVERDSLFASLGYRVVRIPYFVQLTTPVIADLFRGLARDYSDFLDFPHGFIASTVVMPADFCELGLVRFENDLCRFSYIRDDILQSLRRALEKRGDWRVICPPSRLQPWLGNPDGRGEIAMF
jgi:hypothetical protein